MVDLLRPNPRFPITAEQNSWGTLLVTTTYNMLDAFEEEVTINKVVCILCILHNLFFTTLTHSAN